MLLEIITLAVSAPPAGLATGSPTQLLNKHRSSDSVEIRYFDPLRERRGIFLVNDINTSFDIRLEVNCPSRACLVDLPKLFERFRGVSVTEPCEGPPYARVTLRSLSREVDTVYIDYSGKCALYDGKFYRLSESLLLYFRTSSVGDWTS